MAAPAGMAPELRTKWLTWQQTGRVPCPVLYVLSGWTSSSTIAWAEPIHISWSARVSDMTQGHTVPRGGIGIPMETIPSMMVGYDTTCLPAREVHGIAACLRLKFPVYIAATVFSIQESDSRAFMPLGVLVSPSKENLPRDWSHDGNVVAPPGLLSGRDFRGITSPLAYAAIPCPWRSVIAAIKWANAEFKVAITPWVFCQLATVLWMENPVTKVRMTDSDIPWEVLYIPLPVLEALAEADWVPWHWVERFEIEQCRASYTVPMSTPIPLPDAAPVA